MLALPNLTLSIFNENFRSLFQIIHLFWIQSSPHCRSVQSVVKAGWTFNGHYLATSSFTYHTTPPSPYTLSDIISTVRCSKPQNLYTYILLYQACIFSDFQPDKRQGPQQSLRITVHVKCNSHSKETNNAVDIHRKLSSHVYL